MSKRYRNQRERCVMLRFWLPAWQKPAASGLQRFEHRNAAKLIGVSKATAQSAHAALTCTRLCTARRRGGLNAGS